MESLVINKGYKEYSINGDESAVIRVTTTDFGLADRLRTLQDDIAAIISALEKHKKTDDADEVLNAVRQADIEVKEKLDEVFNSDVSAKVFGGMNCLSFAGGQPVVLNFLEAIIPKIAEDLAAEQKAAQEKISRYTEAAAQYS